MAGELVESFPFIYILPEAPERFMTTKYHSFVDIASDTVSWYTTP